MAHKELSFDDEDGIYPADNAEDDEIDNKLIPRSQLAEIIDAVDDEKSNFDDDLDRDIALGKDDTDDD